MKLISVLLFYLFTLISCAQSPNAIEKPKVDERVELLSIVFRLAESDEYSSEIFKLYTDKIHDHYDKYKNHELIKFIKKLRAENGVGFDAVMAMAVHLDKKLNPIVEFTDDTPEVRWGKDNANKFVRLLKEFYKDSNSEIFFQENEKLYHEISKRFLPIYERLDLNWYTKFYGKEPNEKFIIINGPGNGGGNYGPSVHLKSGNKQVYAIMGTWKIDSTGMADFTISSYFPTLLHEFNHSFVNYLLEKNPEPFRQNGEILYAAVKEKMNSGNYQSWQTMFNEALVRAAVIKYMKDNSFPEKEIRHEVTEQISRGFLWIEELVSELEKYDLNRDVYPTLESYYPVLIKAYDTYAKNIDDLVAKSEIGKARFLSLKEFTNGDKNVTPSLKQVTINFDKPFTGVNFIRPADDGSTFPNFTNLKYSEDRKSVILEWTLENNKDYKFILIGLSPQQSTKKDSEDYLISFKTK